MWPEGSTSSTSGGCSRSRTPRSRICGSTTLLAALLDRTRQILEVDTCAILLLDEETNELVARAALGIEEEVEQGVRIPVGGGFAGRIAAEKRPVILDDVDHARRPQPDPARERDQVDARRARSSSRARCAASSTSARSSSATSQTDEVELLQLVADRAALAIEHARLFEAERAARERIENIQAVTDAALAHLEVDELLAVLLPRIRDILRADTCAVLLLDEESNELVARAALGIEEEVEQGVRIPVGEGFAGRVAGGRTRPTRDRRRRVPGLEPDPAREGDQVDARRAALVGGTSLGVLHVGSLTPRDFTRDEVELLQLVAERVAIAIERARLHEETVQLDQLKLNFVAIASHELRTPATSVYGVLKTLVERGPELNEELREELLRVGVEQGERLRPPARGAARPLASRRAAIDVEPRPVVLKLGARRGRRRRAGPTGTTSSSTSPTISPPSSIRSCSSASSRTCSSNAARYGAPPIRIDAQQRDLHLRVAVEDAGPGDPAGARGADLRSLRAWGASGHGLGLAIARAYAQAHGGDLIYDPRAAARASSC